MKPSPRRHVSFAPRPGHDATPKHGSPAQEADWRTTFRDALPSGAILLLALLLGGGTQQGFWSDAIVQIACLPVLALAPWRGMWSGQRAGGQFALVILSACLLLPLLQLVPLPPLIWAHLGGRASIASAYEVAGVSRPWLGISLDPAATWRAVLALVPPATVFVLVLRLSRRARRGLVLSIIAVAFVSVILGLAQLAQGPESALRFYGFTNESEAVGFFANRNHFAALLYCALPFTAAWAVGLATDRRREAIVGLVLCLLVFASLLLGLGMARSRAGLALAMLGGVASMAVAYMGSRSQNGAHRIIFAGAFIGIVLILQFASLGILRRLTLNVAEGLRWEFTATTLRAALDFLPFGSGVGTFQDIYRMYEGPEQLYIAYVNHAHNDYAELLLEAGIPAIVIFAVFLIWLVRAVIRSWQTPQGRRLTAIDLSLPRAASIAVILLLCHAIADYPLRTTALSTFFAFACALMIAPIRPGGRAESAQGGLGRAEAADAVVPSP